MDRTCVHFRITGIFEVENAERSVIPRHSATEICFSRCVGACLPFAEASRFASAAICRSQIIPASEKRPSAVRRNLSLVVGNNLPFAEAPRIVSAPICRSQKRPASCREPSATGRNAIFERMKRQLFQTIYNQLLT